MELEPGHESTPLVTFLSPVAPHPNTAHLGPSEHTIQFFSISMSSGRNELKRLIHLSHIPSPILHTPLPLYIPRRRSSSTFHNSLPTTHHLLALDRRHSSRQSRHLTTRLRPITSSPALSTDPRQPCHHRVHARPPFILFTSPRLKTSPWLPRILAVPRYIPLKRPS
jgi:hypothetical protein